MYMRNEQMPVILAFVESVSATSEGLPGHPHHQHCSIEGSVWYSACHWRR